MEKKHLLFSSSIDRWKATFYRAKLRGQQHRSHLRTMVTPKRAAWAVAGIALLSIGGYMTAFYWPRSLVLSFANPTTCFANPIALPSITSKTKDTSYKVEHKSAVTIGDFPLYSHTTCISPLTAPKERTTTALVWKMPGNPFLKKTLTVHTPAHPRIVRSLDPTAPMPTRRPISISMDQIDRTFDYRLEANGASALCSKKDHEVSCDPTPLNLQQATAYAITITRFFKGSTQGTLMQAQATTVEPLAVIASSMPAGHVAYDFPTSISLTFNKNVAQPADIQVQNRNSSPAAIIPTDISVEGPTVIVTFKEQLPRSTTFALSIPILFSTDGAYLPAAYELPFSTSGGPKVRNVSIGSARVQPGSAITLTFDTAIGGNQNLQDFIRIEAPGNVQTSVIARGNRVTISPADIGRCTPFTVRVVDGIKNEHGVAGGSAWAFRSRTLCQTIFSIGSSVQGRGITAYRFGTGPNKIVLVGGTHGDERSSVHILQRWVEQLELNASRIPAHQTIVVIPTLNPDGYASNKRLNTRGVDLNRNFPSYSWKSGVTMPDKSYHATGGGTEPLSEPESRALANYVLSQRPRLVLTYHAAGSVVVPNGSGDSNSIAIAYGQKSSVGYMAPGQTGSFFEYDTTGAFEDWLHDKHGIPALLIELRSRTSNDYSGHQNALWYITGL